MRRVVRIIFMTIFWAFSCSLALADTTVFFSSCQVATPVSSGVTSDTIRSNGYLFTYTRDKLFTGGTGQPIGRPVTVNWPAGVQAQAVTTPPPGNTNYSARVTIKRADGLPFDLPALTFKLLANTAGAGGTLEIMPLLNGQDGFGDPLYFDASGYAGMTFHYDTSPNPWGSTVLMKGFDTYDMTLYVDFALIGLTFDSTAPGEQSCCLSGNACADLTAASCGLQGGTTQGPGTSCSCNACAAPAGPAPAPDGRSGTLPVLASRLTAAGDALQLDWDATSCPAADYNLIYGALSNVASYAVSGAACAMGTSGSFVWFGVPAGNLYFLIVGTDGVGTESSWGVNGANQERGGTIASGTCGVTAKDASATCP
jgi:hypothetical protein